MWFSVEIGEVFRKITFPGVDRSNGSQGTVDRGSTLSSNDFPRRIKKAQQPGAGWLYAYQAYIDQGLTTVSLAASLVFATFDDLRRNADAQIQFPWAIGVGISRCRKRASPSR